VEVDGWTTGVGGGDICVTFPTGTGTKTFEEGDAAWLRGFEGGLRFSTTSSDDVEGNLRGIMDSSAGALGYS
jgi:hypothetical protein